MTPIRCTLLAIAVFVVLGISAFVYFVSNWDAARTASIGAVMPQPVLHDTTDVPLANLRLGTPAHSENAVRVLT